MTLLRPGISLTRLRTRLSRLRRPTRPALLRLRWKSGCP